MTPSVRPVIRGFQRAIGFGLMSVGSERLIEIGDAGNPGRRIDESRLSQVQSLDRDFGIERSEGGIILIDRSGFSFDSIRLPPPGSCAVILNGKEDVSDRLVTSILTLSYTRGFSDEPACEIVSRPVCHVQLGH